ncbi:hypothetical protein [Paraburkholderia kirstenboschensis]|uniref:hypothetical protein n=1 Tax=Paraburkholderia kirstenboschensis TaxID=1245436 RepID=UPI0013E2A14F
MRTFDKETASQGGVALRPETQIKGTIKLTHSSPVAPNLLDQVFAVTAANQAWRGDMDMATKPSKPQKSIPQNLLKDPNFLIWVGWFSRGLTRSNHA